jgi:hypothetical protein
MIKYIEKEKFYFSPNDPAAKGLTVTYHHENLKTPFKYRKSLKLLKQSEGEGEGISNTQRLFGSLFQ